MPGSPVFAMSIGAGAVFEWHAHIPPLISADFVELACMVEPSLKDDCFYSRLAPDSVTAAGWRSLFRIPAGCDD